MNNRRKLIRIEAKDFLEIRPMVEAAKKIKGEVLNFTLMGICFSSVVEWRKGQNLYIEYFIPEINLPHQLSASDGTNFDVEA